MPNFIEKILGRGAKETIEAIGDTIDKIDKSDEKLQLQLRYQGVANANGRLLS